MSSKRGQKGGKTEDDGEEIPEHITALAQEVASLKDAATSRAISMGSRDFYRDNPDAQKFDKQIGEVVAQGLVNVADPSDPDAYYRASEAAWAIVRANQGPRAEAGRRASGVEGGTSEGAGQVDPWDPNLPLDKLREIAKGGDVVMR